MNIPRTIKCVVVGNAVVGKTCLLISYIKNEFPKEYVPTVFDIHAIDVEVDNKPYVLNLFDTAGHEEYDYLRPLGYPKTNVFLICFSVVDRESFESVKNKWVLEVKHFCPTARYILVATKVDLRQDTSIKRIISSHMGQRLSREINASKYLECSALTMEGLQEVFEEVVKFGALRPINRSFSCNLL